MAQLRPGIADTVTSGGIKPHGDSQRCRQSLPRSPSLIAHSNRDTDLRTQTNQGPLMHSYACSQATRSHITPYDPVCAVKNHLKEVCLFCFLNALYNELKKSALSYVLSFFQLNRTRPHFKYLVSIRLINIKKVRTPVVCICKSKISCCGHPWEHVGF